MTWIMSPVLTTLKTHDLNRLNNARSHTDGDGWRFSRLWGYLYVDFDIMLLLLMQISNFLQRISKYLVKVDLFWRGLRFLGDKKKKDLFHFAFLFVTRVLIFKAYTWLHGQTLSLIILKWWRSSNPIILIWLISVPWLVCRETVIVT